MERIPPHSEEAERSAIGAAMLSKDALLDVAEEVRPVSYTHLDVYKRQLL